MSALIAEALVDELCAGGRRAYMLLDAARHEQIYPSLLRSDCRWLCLYRGDAAVRMAEVAPYLVEVTPRSAYARWVVDRGWGESWAVFVNAPVDIEKLRTHFRRFVMVQMPDGKTVYFRFYDPRVLRVYLPTCNAAEIETVFGPVERFLMESIDGTEAIAFARAGGTLIECRIGTLLGREEEGGGD